jgi:hypothetical protein
MNNITLQKASVNTEALNAALLSALTTTFKGISTSAGQVIVHLDDNATPIQAQQAEQIVTSHNPAVLTPEQQAEVDRLQALEATWQAAEPVTLNLGDFSGAAQQGLVKKVLWLEQAILDLQRRLGSG